jgi:hypothetical protein
MSPDTVSTNFFADQVQNSPRKSHLYQAARQTLHRKLFLMQVYAPHPQIYF